MRIEPSALPQAIPTAGPVAAATPAPAASPAPSRACTTGTDTNLIASSVEAALQSLEVAQASPPPDLESVECPTTEDYANGRGRPGTQSSSTEVG